MAGSPEHPSDSREEVVPKDVFATLRTQLIVLGTPSSYPLPLFHALCGYDKVYKGN